MSEQLSFPKEKIKIVLFEGIHDSALAHFAEQGYTQVERLSTALSGEALRDKLDGVHMVGVRSRTQLTGEVIAAANRLMAIGCFCIGTNQVELPAASVRGIPVFNAPHSNTRSVAEMVIAESVMLLRGLSDKNAAAHEGRWLKSAHGSHELRGKTLGIVGYGHIGSQVSILAEAMGMRVIYQDVLPKLPMGNAQQVASLDELLPAADIVTLHVPQDSSTADLMDAARIAQMRPDAYLINASRGTVVDVDALAAAIRGGRLAGAAVDVFPREPASLEEPFQSPLQGLPNVVLTPHIGGSTQEAQVNIGREVATKLTMYSDQGATVGAVNFPQLSLAPQHNAHRLLHIHRNQPGVLAAMNRAFAASELNILGQHLQTTPELGYVVTDVDRQNTDDLGDELAKLPGTIRFRILY
ncbi:phosphoglycerate dehydrogenase [Haliangium ochraceum]|uniref:D-3-phosphoglycerate dehydrogenase n=1 Tax=Haliangium ochraceum (strain DSM 14365 / JCM 11303 / SMP-2) TaxID=502025 RepID=D0LQ62_HALO1|nr:phosphoglycerate dehydrogenase [Haliangium ochraceum]ACY17099.1 D-isomer specific 2-hydroxyacid dehydrogenase NAD-binding protein [Haliangium ochraceum DSM 14365]